MQLNIRFKGLESSDAVKGYLEERFHKLDKFLPPTVVMNATIGDDKLRKTTEINFNYQGVNYVAKQEADSLFASIDEVVDKLVRQLSKNKDKRTGRPVKTPEE